MSSKIFFFGCDSSRAFLANHAVINSASRRPKRDWFYGTLTGSRSGTGMPNRMFMCREKDASSTWAHSNLPEHPLHTHECCSLNTRSRNARATPTSQRPCLGVAACEAPWSPCCEYCTLRDEPNPLLVVNGDYDDGSLCESCEIKVQLRFISTRHDQSKQPVWLLLVWSPTER